MNLPRQAIAKQHRAARRERLTQGLALAALLLMGGLAIAGPSGVFAWSDASKALAQREARIAQLQEQREDLRQRVDALDPDNADPDMVVEMMRRNLNVVHPDEVILPKPQPQPR
ncbi:septum formation initiator family protein [Citromicrobium bathyomarinum]|jgi:cell division protein FtsB|uniref:FtsB family cell division protein n=3 Tax=Alphaproteobacteria TaxID=28211 RepID=UPI000225E7A2|nr:septum formation initiator family protein [Citromicrobium sp. JLT1363]MBL4792377.1 septum formation initiator family protein [Citromicrobium sp.]MBO80183.1 septum formation initiator [Citromicrobium sp.]|tara:strand:+ start:1017 stop:1358 length:342 start_codon:yes stop_codon:yes gene_type:complete